MLPSQSLDATSLADEYEYLRNIPITSYNDVTPRVLIGNDNFKLSMVSRYKCGGAKDPVGFKTALGWTMCGSTKSKDNYSFHIRKCTCEGNNISDSFKDLENISKDHYELENLGIYSRRDRGSLINEELACRALRD